MVRMIASVSLAAALMVSVATSAAAPRYLQTVTLMDKPTAAETVTVRSVLGRSFGKEWSDYEKSKGRAITFTVGHADLNGDGRSDLLVYLSDYHFGYCGSAGCAGYAILATPKGYADKPIELAIFGGKVTVLPVTHKGMHDLRYDDATYIFKWDGKRYH